MADIDALSKLPEFAWRGTEWPILDSEYSFRHENAEHKLSFGDVTFVEGLGAQNPTFRYTIPMRQGIAIGAYKDLFLKIGKLEADIYNREPGPLVDPIFGRWTARPVEFSCRADGKSRDGVDVEVSFVWAPDLDEDVRGQAATSLADLRSDAAALDAEIEKMTRKHDVPPPGPTINPLDAVSAVTGQVDRALEKTKLALEDFAYRVEKTERYCKKVIRVAKDPDAFGAYRTARRIRTSAERTRKNIADLTANIVPIVVGQTKTVLTVAAENAMTVKELLAMNVQLAASPMVAAGTTVNTYGPRKGR
jgi:hypothetical protein